MQLRVNDTWDLSQYFEFGAGATGSSGSGGSSSPIPNTQFLHNTGEGITIGGTCQKDPYWTVSGTSSSGPYAVKPNPNYFSPTTDVNWISPFCSEGSLGSAPSSGTYVYKMTFDLTAEQKVGFPPISGAYGADNGLVSVTLNGVDQGISCTPVDTTCFDTRHPFTLNSDDLQVGTNTIEFTVHDLGIVTAFYCEWDAADVVPPPLPISVPGCCGHLFWRLVGVESEEVVVVGDIVDCVLQPANNFDGRWDDVNHIFTLSYWETGNVNFPTTVNFELSCDGQNWPEDIA